MTRHFQMIDVGGKPATRRVAIAGGEIHVGPAAFALIRDRALPKGDALMMAEIAGITGAKQVSSLLPLCHPLPLEQVAVETALDEARACVTVLCRASVTGRTGVEMEALAGVNAALLTLWDLTKMVEPNLRLDNIRLLVKTGGKAGVWLNPDGVPDALAAEFAAKPAPVLAGRRAAVITLSDRAVAGTYPDLSGPKLAAILADAGAEIVETRLIGDDRTALAAAIADIVATHAPDLLLTTGGTGVAPRDVTPDAIRPLLDREIPGIGELLRLDGTKYTPLSWASRAIGGTIGRTLVATLPGNPAAIVEGMDALLPTLLPHLLKIMNTGKSP